jgi:peptidoglycan/LPS O-acetylase OafA/YrhL
MEARARFERVDALRSLAAVSVVVFHSSVGQVHTLTSLFANLSIGVPVFFAISGFVLYRPFVAAGMRGDAAPGLARYARRRLLRIVPGYWVALTLTALLLGEHYVFTPSGVVTFFGFAQIYVPGRFFDGLPPAWTLCLEVTFYVFVPFWAALVARRGPRTQLAALALLAAVAYAWQLAELPVALPQYFDHFAVGMALAVVSVAAVGATPRWLDRRPGLAWAGALGVYVVACRLVPDGDPDGVALRLIHHGLFAAVAGLMLAPLVLGQDPSRPLRRLTAHPALTATGIVSYGIYLYHEPILELLDRAGLYGVPHGWVVALAIAVPASIVVAAVSWRFVERPALRLADRPGARASASAVLAADVPDAHPLPVVEVTVP